MTVKPLILIVDDEPEVQKRIRFLLRDCACRVETASNGGEAVERVRRKPVPSLVLLDMSIPGIDGLETLKRLRRFQPGLRVVMMASVDDPRKVVRSVRLGAQDCLRKPFDKSSLNLLLREWLPLVPDENDIEPPAVLEERLGDGSFFVAASPAMRKLRAIVGQVARTEIPVLCIGESGTGKEVVARLLHQLSKRGRYSLLKVNCAAMPSELLESELFGYEQGAFTGAVRPKPGKFELCAKGTILLDEIAELPLNLQAKLLHVLQDGEFTRLGGRSRIKADVRVVAATNIDVRAALAEKRLREDLYYRLSTVVLEIPPLRERKEEIPILLRHFLQKHGGQCGLPSRSATHKVMEFARRHDWPGNVRELENFVKRYLALGEQSLAVGNGNHLQSVGTDNGTEKGEARSPASHALKSFVRGVKHDAEVSAIRQALEQTNWNRKEAAKLLEISYKTFLDKLRVYALDKAESQHSASCGGSRG